MVPGATWRTRSACALLSLQERLMIALPFFWGCLTCAGVISWTRAAVTISLRRL